jgi:hypothetical protein
MEEVKRSRMTRSDRVKRMIGILRAHGRIGAVLGRGGLGVGAEDPGRRGYPLPRREVEGVGARGVLEVGAREVSGLSIAEGE